MLWMDKKAAKMTRFGRTSLVIPWHLRGKSNILPVLSTYVILGYLEINVVIFCPSIAMEVIFSMLYVRTIMSVHEKLEYIHTSILLSYVMLCHSNVMIVDTNRKTFSARREIKVGNWIFLFWKLFYSLLSSALRLSFMTHEFMDIPCIFAFWKKGIWISIFIHIFSS